MFNNYCASFAVSVQRLNRTVFFVPQTFLNRFRAQLLLPFIRLLQFWCIVSCKIFFQDETEVGKGVRLSSRGRVILGAKSIGAGCVIHHNVTLGMNLSGREEPGIPTLGKNVWIGPDTLINGAVHIGEGVTILGGTVLTKSLPTGYVVSGNPPRIVCKDFDNSKLLKSNRWDFDADTIREMAESYD